jgi:sporulation protein YlmC with PRC-barrel domain
MQLSASSLNGTSVVNGSGDELGTIEDLMVDVATGRVNYAVLSFGGILGIGDKYFAVPMEAFSVDTRDERLVLNESKERLENAPGFDKDDWPSEASQEWTRSVMQYYNVS